MLRLQVTRPYVFPRRNFLLYIIIGCRIKNVAKLVAKRHVSARGILFKKEDGVRFQKVNLFHKPAYGKQPV